MDETYTDEFLTDVLDRTRVIAVVGVSLDEKKPSFYVSEFLQSKGYRVIPVNPVHAGKSVFGETIRASLSDIEEDVDMVDLFRRPEHVPPLVDEALKAFPSLGTIWMQLGIAHEDAAATARAAGVDVVMNRCPKIEYPRLMGR